MSNEDINVIIRNFLHDKTMLGQSFREIKMFHFEVLYLRLKYASWRQTNNNDIISIISDHMNWQNYPQMTVLGEL